MKAIITGASNGIGKDMAELLSSRGYEVVLVARSEDKLKQLQNSLPTPAEVVVADLSRPESCFALYERYQNEPIDLLVNNAGYGIFGRFDETELSDELNMLDLNIKAVHILTKLFVKKMEEQNHGFILNVASSAAFFVGPLLSSYYASKAYVLRLTQAVQAEVNKSNKKVHLSVLCPGPVDTGFNQRAGVQFGLKGLDSRGVAEYALRQMFQRKQVIIPGITMKIAKFGSRFLPDRLITEVAYHFQRKKQ